MSDYLLSIDPGISTGISLLSYTEDTVPVLEGAWQFSGGAEELSEWLDFCYNEDEPEWDFADLQFVYRYYAQPGSFKVICEAFTARNTKGFSYTTDSLEALVGIGVLVGRGLVDRNTKGYRAPALQYLVGGKGAEAKKRQHKFLRDSGYYRTGKDFGTPDADDFRSSCAHALNYLAREGHLPTFKMISDWVERNPCAS